MHLMKGLKHVLPSCVVSFEIQNHFHFSIQGLPYSLHSSIAVTFHKEYVGLLFLRLHLIVQSNILHSNFVLQVS